MSDKLPLLSSKELIKILNNLGFVPIRQKGSHVYMKHKMAEVQLCQSIAKR